MVQALFVNRDCGKATSAALLVFVWTVIFVQQASRYNFSSMIKQTC